MRVIFLGCGYLGYNLSKQLEESFDVEVWGIESPYVSRCEHFKYVDVFSPEELAQLDVKDAIVVDTVALVNNTSLTEDEESDLLTLKQIYQTMFEVLLKGQIRQYVFMSSGGTVYGDVDHPAKESDPVNPISYYAKTKVLIENLLKEMHMPYLILRLSNPYGGYQDPNKQQGVIPILIRSAMKRTPFMMYVNEDSSRDYFYIDDLAKALWLLLKKGVQNETINVGSGQATSIKTVIEIVERLMGKEIIVEHKKSIVPAVDTNVLDIDKLHELTGYEPKVSVEDGIRYEVKRIKEEYA